MTDQAMDRATSAIARVGWLYVSVICIHTAHAQGPAHLDSAHSSLFVKYESSNWADDFLKYIGLQRETVGRSLALVAGISDYDELDDLRPAQEDMDRLVNHLSTVELFDEIVVLRNEDMTAQNLRFFLRSYFPKVTSGSDRSRFLFAYSGHGYSEGRESYLLGSDAEGLSDKDHSVDMSELRLWIDHTVGSAFQSLVLINACHSGAFFARPFGDEEIEVLLDEPGAHAITASGSSEKSWHNPTIGPGSIFFEKLFSGLDGAADLSPAGGDGIIQFDELLTYLRREVKLARKDQNPKADDISRDGSVGGFFFLDRERKVHGPALATLIGTPFGGEEEETSILRPRNVVLAIIGQIGMAGATGHAVEYAGPVIRNMDRESRMTVCNMTIEAGGRSGMVAPDETTFAYCKGREFAPKGEKWEHALADWRSLASDDDAVFDTEVTVDGDAIAPMVTWGTNPENVIPVTGVVPDPSVETDPNRRKIHERALAYMGLTPGMKMTDVAVDKVFIGSCTNGRIEDFRAAAAVVKGRKAVVSSLVVPGSVPVKRQAEAEGLDKIFTDAGMFWGEPTCSMCVGMNGDLLQPGQRSASTSNRNFMGRQGEGGRTHLVGPAMAAAAAVTGSFADVRDLMAK